MKIKKGKLIGKANNVIVEQWRQFAMISSGAQQDYFKRKIMDAHVTKCVSAKDVFTKDELKRIKRYCDIKPKMCYRTAYRLANLFPDRVKYVEGEVTIFNRGFGIDHAWNLVDDKYYVDLTFEFALEEEVGKETYVALGEYDMPTICEVAADLKFYGGVYGYLYSKNIINKQKK